MKKPVACTLLTFVLTATLMSAQQPVSADGIAITHISVIDTKLGWVRHDMTVVVHGDRIGQVVPAKHAQTPEGVRSVDGTGKGSTFSSHLIATFTCDNASMGRKLVYESDRLFSVFGYSISHGLLLLRSGKSNENQSTRVEVLFQDARAMEIRAWFKCIKIEEIDDPHFLNGQRSKPLEMLESGNKIYALSSSGWEGFVVAGAVLFLEDDGELFGPSALVSEPPVKRWTLG